MIYLVGIYCLILIIALLPKKVKSSNSRINKVSILIPFRNEAESIPALIASIASQWKVEFGELIFINDHSEDSSLTILNEELLKHQLGASVLDLKDSEGKKSALKLGVKHSQHIRILQWDCDITLESDYLPKALAESSNFWTGYVKIKQQSSFLNHFQVWENLASMFVTQMSIRLKIPLMANGANMSYSKNVHVDRKEEYLSGDDLFTMYSFLEQGYSVGFNTNAIVSTYGKTDWKSFFQQRLRWTSKTSAIKDVKYLGLSALIVLGQAAPIWLIVNHSLEFISIILIKTILELTGMILVNNKLRYQKIAWSYLPVILFYPFYVLTLFALSIFIRPTWKGRAIKRKQKE